METIFKITDNELLLMLIACSVTWLLLGFYLGYLIGKRK